MTISKWLVAGAVLLIGGTIGSAQFFVTRNPPSFPVTPSMFVRYEASNPSNTVSTLSQTFTASDVDLANDKLALSGLGFLALSGTPGAARPVFFDNTGGSLPAPLVAGATYWIAPAAVSGYTIFPSVTDAGSVPGGVTGENPIAAQALAELVNPIVLTTTGSGTHRIYTDPAFTTFADMTGNGYTMNVSIPLNRHSYISRHGTGVNTYAELPGTNVRDNTTNITGNIEYGQIAVMGTNKLAGRSQSNGAKQAWSVVAAQLPNYQKHTVIKDTFLSSGVNTSTGNLNSPSHSFVTPDLVNVSVYSAGGSLPTRFSAGVDYFVHKIDASNYTLHPTSTDATNNTSVIIPSTQGSGTMSINAPAKASGGTRSQAFFEWLDPVNSAGNTLSVDISQNGPVGLISATSSAFVISGTSNGNVLNLSTYPDLSKVQMWFPPRGFGPVRSDTGLPLTSGTYWLSATGSSRRLTLSLADAQASVGVSTALCVLCIKYTGVDGFGTVDINYDDSTAYVAFGAGSDNFDNRITLGSLAVYLIKIDWNPAAFATPVWSLWVNGIPIQANVALSQAKGALGSPATDATSAPWTMWNSIANHVPGYANWRATVFGVSTGDIPDAEPLAVANYYKQLYGIP